MPLDTIVDLLSILAAGLAAALICRWLGISAIVGYLVIGTLLGDSVLAWVGGDNHQIDLLAEAGVFLLLFSIGLEFSLDDLWQLRRQLLVGGSLQMALVALPSGLILHTLGFSPAASMVLAAAIALSSTVLVFNALAEFGESSSPHGKRTIGILLFQDLALVPLLLLVPMLTDGKAPEWQEVFFLMGSSLLFVGLIFVSRKILNGWVIPGLASYRSPDIVILFTLVALGGITIMAHALGLPGAVGAFAAGLALGGNRWSAQIDALVLPFRETFAAVFFVSLGLLVDAKIVLASPVMLLLMILAVIALKAIAASIALRVTKLSWQSSFGMALGLAHIGEFAFVLAKLGRNSEVLTEAAYQQIIAIGLGTLILTPFLLRWGLKQVATGEDLVQAPSAPGMTRDSFDGAVVIGVGPIGKQIASFLETQGVNVTLIDRSPINLYPFEQLGFHTAAGDATQPEILRAAHAHDARLVVLCVPDDQIAQQILTQVRRLNPEAQVVVRCRYQSSVAVFRKAQVQFVVSEEQQAYESMVGFLSGLFAEEP